jgi:hypothetical protein
MYDHPCYRVVFDDGAEVIADADHLWQTSTTIERKTLTPGRRVAQRKGNRGSYPSIPPWSIRTTEDIRTSLLDYRGANNHAIPLSQTVDYPERDLPISPYTFGAWLGDGSRNTSALTCADPEIIEAISAEGTEVGIAHARANQGRAYTYYLGPARTDRQRDPDTGQYVSENGLKAQLAHLGVLGNKHIPDVYLTASVDQRWALLQGLMDTDGHCEPNGRAEFTSKSLRLAQDVVELMRSLGLKPRMKTGRAMLNGVDYGPKYRVWVTTNHPLFQLPRKRDRQVGGYRPDLFRRYVTAVEPVPSVPVRCIVVDSPSCLYLAGRDYIVTHNTSFGPWWLYREVTFRGPGDYLAVTSTFDLFKVRMLPATREVMEHTLGVARYWAGDQVLELCEHTFDEATGTWIPQPGKFRATQATDPMWGRIILRSASSEVGLESATAKAAWLDEAGMEEFGLGAWEAILRRLSIHRGRILITTTPYNNTGWLKREVYDRWMGGDPDIEVIQFSSIQNPAFPKEEFEDRQKTMVGYKFSMFYKGQFERPHTLIYPDFRDEPVDMGGHILMPFAIPRTWVRLLGVDPGPVYYTLLYAAVEPVTETLIITREQQFSYKSTAEIAKEVVSGLYFDSAPPFSAYYVGGKPDVQARLDWMQSGAHPVYEPPFSDVESGIDRVTMLIRSQRLRVFSTCMGLRTQFADYKRKMDKLNMPTEEIDNPRIYHFLDALRYIAAGFTDVRTAALVPALPILATYRGDIL